MIYTFYDQDLYKTFNRIYQPITEVTKRKYLRMKSLRNYFNILVYAINIVPFWTIYTILTKVFLSISDILGSIFILNIVLEGIQSNKTFMEIIIPVMIILSVILCTGFLNSLYYAKIDPIAQQRLDEKLTLKMINIIMKTKIKNFDNPDYLNDYVFSANEIQSRVVGSVNIISNLISSIISFIMLVLYLGFISFELIIVVVLSVIVTYIINFKLSRKAFSFAQEKVLYNRKKDYVNRVFYMKKHAMEIRLYLPLRDILLDMYDSSVKNIICTIKKYGLRIGLLNFIKRFNTEVFAFYGSMIIILISIFYGHHGVTTINLIPMTIAVYTLSGSVTNIMKIGNSLKENRIFTDKYFHILSLAELDNNYVENPVSIKKEGGKSLCLNKVTFQYDGNDKPTLKNISMEIPQGKKIALVGENGSGKSTIVKLILGLYDNYQGSIDLSSHEIRSYDTKEYRSLFSVVMQDFQSYPVTLAENVAMDLIEDESKLNNIAKSLNKITFDKNEAITNEFLMNNLTSEFSPNGLNLSKGQLQKMAIARVLFNDKPIVILDEPTSSLDPITEFEVFNNIMRQVSEKTVIIISHRLTATKNADIIYLIDDGEIIESGTHDELIQKNKKYAYMYHLQASKYLDK